MNKCTCCDDVEKRVIDNYTERFPNSKDVSAKLLGYAFVLGGALGYKPYMPIEISHTVVIKKSGIEKRKTEKLNMFFNFCPFCGVTLKEAVIGQGEQS